MHVRDLLNQNKLRITQNREEVLDLLLKSDVAVSTQVIETALVHIDRITLYRTLKTFEDKGLIHKIVDSSQRPKYALCADNCTDHSHDDSHLHFECIDCGNVTCHMDVTIPELHLPDGYTISEINIIAKGHCNTCKM